LGKWLARVVLLEGRRARLCRWDGPVANTAESLSLLAEALGVAIDRGTRIPKLDPAELLFVDLPGGKPDEGLARSLEALPEARVHLVLNAAYENTLLLRQARAYQVCHPEDLILTHLDEEPGRGRIWNLALGTNCAVSHLSAGQNIPGPLDPARAEDLMPV
jgi:hypothetical protein